MERCIEVKNASLSYRFVSRIFRAKKKTGKREMVLTDISFEVYCGEVLGVVGVNGSGKSTLLKMMAGVFKPDKGHVDLNGHSVTLMSLGVGFISNLSGFDNIYLSGLLVGFSKSEIAKKIDKIIAFSELGEAIYDPVKTYSSGMRSKLAFAISTELESDIILIDEVFAVGDTKFKKKSSAKMREMIRDKERTVIIVSNSCNLIKNICNRVIWLDKGKVIMVGETKEVINKYIESQRMET